MPLEAVMRTDDHHLARHRQILEVKKTQDIQVVFLGDSLIRRWEDNMDLWNRYFAGFYAANFGVGSDCLENIKWRIISGELDGISPRVIFVLAGTNNLDKNNAETIANGIGEIAAIIKAKLRVSKIVILGLLPRNGDAAGFNYGQKIVEINGRLDRQFASTDILFRDIGADLANAEGTVSQAIMPDGVHLNRAGYEIIGPKLKAILEELWLIGR